MIVSYDIIRKDKQNNDPDYKFLNSEPLSLSNAEEMILGLVLQDIEGFQGNMQTDVILKQHPTTTQNTPAYYAIINETSTSYTIFHHYKDVGLVTSTHKYDKLFTYRIIKKQTCFNQSNQGSLRRIPMPKRNDYKIMYEYLENKKNGDKECIDLNF